MQVMMQTGRDPSIVGGGSPWPSTATYTTTDILRDIPAKPTYRGNFYRRLPEALSQKSHMCGMQRRSIRQQHKFRDDNGVVSWGCETSDKEKKGEC